MIISTKFGLEQEVLVPLKYNLMGDKLVGLSKAIVESIEIRKPAKIIGSKPITRKSMFYYDTIGGVFYFVLVKFVGIDGNISIQEKWFHEDELVGLE